MLGKKGKAGLDVKYGINLNLISNIKKIGNQELLKNTFTSDLENLKKQKSPFAPACDGCQVAATFYYLLPLCTNSPSSALTNNFKNS